jgi:protein-disulfide isomerase
MHDQLFRSQNEWAGLEDPQTVFTRLVDETGADSDLYEECVTSGAARAQIERSVAEAQNLGFSGTPSFRFVNPALPDAYNLIGAQPYEQFANYIEAIAAGSPPAANQQAQQEGDGDIPVWATSEGLKANPDQPGRTVTGDEYMGDLEASVVVIEFSDFQCPYCSKHVAETEPTLRKTFIEDGRVLWVFKHFPLTNIHPQAFAASVAAECAGDQGKFWEMHDKLFSDPSLWSIEEPNPIFTGFAAELKLEDAAFTNCLASDDAKQRVQNDIDEGARFIQGTPSFIVLKDGTGRIIPGALPTEQFVAALEGVIANGFQ